MNAKTSVFVMCVEAIIYLLLYNLHDCTFKRETSGFVKSCRYNTKLIPPWLNEDMR